MSSGHRTKRHRGENYTRHPSQHISIEERVSRLGEIGSRNTDICNLAKDIDADLMNKDQVEIRINALIAKICRCIVSFPTKVGTYATLIGFLSFRHYDISCQIINALHGSYPIYLEAQKWQEAITIIHLLSSLVNCKVIPPSALLSQYEFLLESTIEESTPQARSDYFVYTVLSSLPYVAQELAQEETKEAFEKVLSTIETYLSNRSKDHMTVIRIWMTNDSTIQMDYLDSLWVQMKNFRANNWNEIFLHRPYNDKEYKDMIASRLALINLPTLQIPSHNDKCIYPKPRIVFRLFEDDVMEGHKAIPGSDKIERYCIEKHIRNLVDEMSYHHTRDCARHLTRMHRFEHLPMKHILVETILGELFAMPKPKHDEIFYYTLLYQFGRIYNTSDNHGEVRYNYDVIVNEGLKVLYDNLETMNVSCITRLVDWLSFHLNCTAFVYPWQNWTDATFKEKTSPRVVFVQDTLRKCVRFSFHKKIQRLVQDSLADLMPPDNSVSYKPVFGDDPMAQTMSNSFKELIVWKADGKTICETLNIVVDGIELPEEFVLKEETHVERLMKIDIFTAVILSIASKSLTHISSAIGKYLNIFKALIRVPSGQIQMLQTIDSCLENHPQLQVILIDKLLKAELIEAEEVCNWVFSDSMKPRHLKSYLWEILNNTISRTIQNVDKLLVEQKDFIEDSKEAADKAKSDAEAAPAKGQSTPTPSENEACDDIEMTKEIAIDEADKTAKEQAAREEKIQLARCAVDEFLLQVFKSFAQTFDQHIKSCETSNISFMDNYYKWMIGRMQEVFYRHNEVTHKIYDRIRVIIDEVPSIGSSIINLNQ